MDKSEYQLWDWHRLLFGNAPAEFLIETFFRVVITYIFLLFIVAWLGKRMSGQITITELGIAIMLGAIVAPPMETPERGVLQGIMILFLVLFLHRNIAALGVYRPRAEKIIQGSLDICVKDGVIQLAVMRKLRISRAQLFAILRMNNIQNLGRVERLYMEASGIFSLFEAKESRPGLSLLPADDDIHSIQSRPGEDPQACTVCGTTVPATAATKCPNCGNAGWDPAVL
jgi:uncharacterized membrane protein YcaP (DUF421 family)